MTKIWNQLRAAFFEKLSAEDRLQFNKLNMLARRVANREDIDDMKKQELIKPLLDGTLRMCKKLTHRD